MGNKTKQSFVIWLTGLSGSGKTTIAKRLYFLLKQEGYRLKIVDGDVIRTKVHKHLGFSKRDIEENNRLIIDLCKRLLDKYDILLVPVIAPFRRTRSYARSVLNNRYIEVYTKAHIDTCIKRDVKGLYKRALSGEIKNFIGISKEVPYEVPMDPNLVIDTEIEDLNLCTNKIVSYLSKKGYL